MNYRTFRLPVLLSLIVILSLALAGCSGGKQVAGVEATPTAVPPTHTPAPTNTATEVPTETPTATPTIVPTATVDRKATQAAKATATQAAIDELVNADLFKYGIDPTLGHVAWIMDEPVILAGDQYATSFYEEIEDIGVVKDFVFQSEIIWDTSGGLSGCGYIFRAPEDWDLQNGNFYTLNIMRLQYNPLWYMSYYEYGYWQYALPSSQGMASSAIEDEKMSKNTLTLQAQGQTFTVFINGVKQQVIENSKLVEGGIAFTMDQESGTSYCEFDKGWLWVFDN